MPRFKHLSLILVLITIVFLFWCKGSNSKSAVVFHPKNQVKPGVEVFLENHLNLVEGKRVGLITNPTGVDSNLQNIIDIFFQNPKIILIALYGPEHGVRGNAQAGEYVPFYIDKKYNIPVFSLYGQSMKPDAGMIKDIDSYMRSFDTVEAGKTPDRETMKDLDVMIFDIQDVGTRIYTYIATMAYCMEACAEAGVDFIVLDRPNPINGIDIEGPLIEYPEQSSFVGVYPIPVRHGMTAGELAMLFNGEFFKKKVGLMVIHMQGWGRRMWYDETSLPWVIPSPNMPTLDTATVYPGQVFLEGTNISEGRGTTKPFEIFGAPWIDGYEFTKALNALELPGIKFREVWFTPTFSKYKGEACGGAQIHVLKKSAYKPFTTTLYLIKIAMAMYPKDFQFHKDYFDKIMGTKNIRESLEQNEDIEKICETYQQDLIEFRKLREKYLIYE